MSTDLDLLLRRPDIWKPGERRAPSKTGLPTGSAALDGVLRESGWPRGALVELLSAQRGVGELRLLLPTLAHLSERGFYQLWIDPPCLPFGPGLAWHGIHLQHLVVVQSQSHRQWLWAAEQALRSTGCGAVVCWAGAGRSRYAELRKLQVAAGERSCVGFVFGDPRGADSASPAALRLRLAVEPEGLAIHVLKQRGTQAGQRVLLETPIALRKQLPLRERPVVVSGPRMPLSIAKRTSVGTLRQEVWQ
jgi:cell division inhibitor SulA/protein ImuA